MKKPRFGAMVFAGLMSYYFKAFKSVGCRAIRPTLPAQIYETLFLISDKSL